MLPLVSTVSRARTLAMIANGVRPNNETSVKIVGGSISLISFCTLWMFKGILTIYEDVKERIDYYHETKQT